MKADHEATVLRLFEACRKNGLEFLLEIIPSKVAPVDDMSSAMVIQRFYDIGVYPDWWKLEPMKSAKAWANACDAIERNDANTRGIVVLGLEAPAEDLYESFKTAAAFPLVKGFAVGRTIFAHAARNWLSGNIDDQAAVSDMAQRYEALCAAWEKARNTVTKDAGVAA
jgi:5-dehydro-2-deoxygluconokinase